MAEGVPFKQLERSSFSTTVKRWEKTIGKEKERVVSTVLTESTLRRESNRGCMTYATAEGPRPSKGPYTL